MHPPINLAHEIANNPDRFISSLGIDPSSEVGSNLIACRLRLYWLARGFDVPASVSLTVACRSTAWKDKRPPVYSPRLHVDQARRVRENEVPALRAAINAEIGVWLNAAKTQVAA